MTEMQGSCRFVLYDQWEASNRVQDSESNQHHNLFPHPSSRPSDQTFRPGLLQQFAITFAPPGLDGNRCLNCMPQQFESSNRRVQVPRAPGHQGVCTGVRVSLGDARPKSYFLPIEPHFVTFFFARHFVANPSTNSTKKRERHLAEVRKNEKMKKRTICAFKCWLCCPLASFEALQSLEKNIDDPTPSWSAVPFLHGTVRFSGTHRRPRRTSPVNQHQLPSCNGVTTSMQRRNKCLPCISEHTGNPRSSRAPKPSALSSLPPLAPHKLPRSFPHMHPVNQQRCADGRWTCNDEV